MISTRADFQRLSDTRLRYPTRALPADQKWVGCYSLLFENTAHVLDMYTNYSTSLAGHPELIRMYSVYKGGYATYSRLVSDLNRIHDNFHSSYALAAHCFFKEELLEGLWWTLAQKELP